MSRLRLMGRAAATAVALAVLPALAGCGPRPSASDGELRNMSLEQTVQMLRERPDVVQIMAAYNRLQAKILKDLDAAGLTKDWSTILPGDSAGCIDFGEEENRLNAESRATDSVASETTIPDADWPTARKIVEQDAAVEGFDDTQVLKDRPGYHDIVIHGRYGSSMHFLTHESVVLGITSGCHRIPGKPIDPDHPDSTAT